MENLPKEIYLQVNPAQDTTDNFYQMQEITWNSDRVFENDIRYVRATDEDLMRYGVEYYDGNELMAEITGYELNIRFNMRLFQDMNDVYNCAKALSEVFVEALLKQVVTEKKDLNQQPEGINPILGKEK